MPSGLHETEPKETRKAEIKTEEYGTFQRWTDGIVQTVHCTDRNWMVSYRKVKLERRPGISLFDLPSDHIVWNLKKGTWLDLGLIDSIDLDGIPLSVEQHDIKTKFQERLYEEENYSVLMLYNIHKVFLHLSTSNSFTYSNVVNNVTTYLEISPQEPDAANHGSACLTLSSEYLHS